MISVTGHMDDGFNYKPENYFEFLVFDCNSMIETLEENYDFSDGVDIQFSIDGIADSAIAIYSDRYADREHCIRFFRSEEEASDILGDDIIKKAMPISEFKQISADAVFQLCARIINLIEIEKSVENDDYEPEVYDLGSFDDELLEHDMDVEKASYLAILKSEADRVFLNLLMADNIHNAILQKKSRLFLQEAHRKGAVKTNKIWDGPREFSISQAKKMWEADDRIRIKTMVEKIQKLIEDPVICTKNKIKDAPEPTTIRKWIKGFAPPNAKKPGRPSIN